MNVAELAALVEQAATQDPPGPLAEFCGEYYRPYYYLLYLLARRASGHCVELGVEKGRGAFAMLLAGAEVWGLDTTRTLEVDLLRREFGGFHFLEVPSTPVPPQVSGPVGLLHLDTEHSFERAKTEFWAWKDLLVPGSVACFDDVHADGHGVGRFVVTLPWPGVLDERLHPSCGYAVVLYDGER